MFVPQIIMTDESQITGQNMMYHGRGVRLQFVPECRVLRVKAEVKC